MPIGPCSVRRGRTAIGRINAILTSFSFFLGVGAMSSSAAQPRWDSVKGVWEGNAAAAGDVGLVNPLWIFGYGSLCWKADFPFDEKIVGHVTGWRRYFAQRSTDHRGTPASPGLVATLLTDADLEALSIRSPSAPASVTCGTCYRIGEADAADVLAALDFREKGGYTRAVVDVTPSSGGEPVRALVYSATPSNPGFDAEAIRDERAAAQMISTAHGPSGANRDYLTNLAAWLERVEEADEHVAHLVAMLPPTSAAEDSSD
jgi:cation transport protein ChaC